MINIVVNGIVGVYNLALDTYPSDWGEESQHAVFYRRDRNLVDTIEININQDDDVVRSAMIFLGLLPNPSIRKPLGVTGVGDAFVAIFEALDAQWRIRYDKPYVPVREYVHVDITPYRYVADLDTLSPNDVLLLAMFGSKREVSWVKEWISNRYMCDQDFDIMHLYRIAQHYVQYGSMRLEKYYKIAWRLFPASAHHSGEQHLLLPYRDVEDSRIHGLISYSGAMNRIMAIPVMRELYERKLLSNAIIAGGSISAILTRGRMFEDSDIDIFIYGDNKERTIRDIMYVIDKVYGAYTLSVGGSVIYVMPDSPSEERRMIQIVSSQAKSADGILFNFDMSHISVGFNNDGILGTPDFFYWTTYGGQDGGTVTRGGQVTVPIRYLLRKFRVEKAIARGYILKNMERSFYKSGTNEHTEQTKIEAPSIDAAINILEKDGKFRNDLESIYHSAIRSHVYGNITILHAHAMKANPCNTFDPENMSIPTQSRLNSVVYTDEDNNVRVLMTKYRDHEQPNEAWSQIGHSQRYNIVVLDSDLLLKQSPPLKGEVYEMIVTPTYVILVKKRCLKC